MDAMPPDLINDVTSYYLTQSVLGVTCIVLALTVLKLWSELKAERSTHKTELAAKDALIKELYDDRLTEARVGFDIARTTQSSLDAFLAAVRGKGQL